MKILLDIGHPAHVHYLKNLALEMQKRGHEFLFTTRKKEVTEDLLKKYNLNYISFGPSYKSKIGKIFGLLRFSYLMMVVSIRFKPDIFINGTFYSAFVSWLLNKHHISMEDTGNMEQVALYRPFTDVILTSSSFHKELGIKQIRYNSYHELAYLNPKYYTADEKIYQELGISKNQKYVVLRFISWNASHDVGQSGLDFDLKINLIEFLKKTYKVFISSESVLPKEFQQYKLAIGPEKIHDVLFYATLYIGEGATMASECAMLGTPAVYVNSMEAGTIDEQEKYGLLFHFRNSSGVFEKVSELSFMENLKDEWKRRQQRMIEEKINLTDFLVWFVENYPKSKTILKKNPDYQYQFK